MHVCTCMKCVHKLNICSGWHVHLASFVVFEMHWVAVIAVYRIKRKWKQVAERDKFVGCNYAIRTYVINYALMYSVQHCWYTLNIWYATTSAHSFFVHIFIYLLAFALVFAQTVVFILSLSFCVCVFLVFPVFMLFRHLWAHHPFRLMYRVHASSIGSEGLIKNHFTDWNCISSTFDNSNQIWRMAFSVLIAVCVLCMCVCVDGLKIVAGPVDSHINQIVYEMYNLISLRSAYIVMRIANLKKKNRYAGFSVFFSVLFFLNVKKGERFYIWYCVPALNYWLHSQLCTFA